MYKLKDRKVSFGRSSFTLIELLVVIAIIALLMAILMPALQRVKKQAQEMVCCSNLREYGLAMRMYLDDNDSTFPYVNTWLFNDNPFGCEWHDARRNLNKRPELAGPMWRYLKAADIHLCPFFKNVAKQVGNCVNACNGEYPIDPLYGYVMNAFLNGDIEFMVPEKYQPVLERAKKESGVKRPADVYLFSEENTWKIDGLSNDIFNDNSLHAIPAPHIDDCFATFHKTSSGDLDSGVANAVFVDGHVDYVSPRPLGNTFKLSWPGGEPIPEW